MVSRCRIMLHKTSIEIQEHENWRGNRLEEMDNKFEGTSLVLFISKDGNAVV
jgi:hypothetical protein